MSEPPLFRTIRTRGAAGADALPEPVRFVLDQGNRFRLSLVDVGLACCAVEFVAASVARRDAEESAPESAAGDPVAAEVMVVSGTVTDKMAPAVRRLYERLPDPKYVVSFGSCANCGGPYWDSYCVTKGVDQIVPVDVYVPGCPPRPEALLQGIARLRERIAAGGDGRA
jgi:NADH-quinone oxidoreductase subunit B